MWYLLLLWVFVLLYFPFPPKIYDAWIEKGIITRIAQFDTNPKGTIVLLMHNREFGVKTKSGIFTISNFDLSLPANSVPNVGDCIKLPLKKNLRTGYIYPDNYKQAKSCN